MSELKYLDKRGTFTLDNPDLTSYMYFPLANEAGMMSAITPDLGCLLYTSNFFNMIPKSLDEAAMIDGAGSFRVFYHIAVRLSISTILVVFLFSFVFNWKDVYKRQV